MKEALKAEKQRERKNEKSETHKSLSTTTECVANAFYYIFSSFRVFEDDLQCTQTGTHWLWPAYVLRTHTHTTNKFIKMVFIYLWRCLCSVFTITYVFIGSRFDFETEKILNKHTLSRPTARQDAVFFYLYFFLWFCEPCHKSWNGQQFKYEQKRRRRRRRTTWAHCIQTQHARGTMHTDKMEWRKW